MSRGSLIYAPIYGTGLGHSYRTAAILEALSSRGHRVVASSWGEGLRYLRFRGIPCVEVPELDVVWGGEGKMRFKDTLRNMSSPFARFVNQVEVEEALIARLSPRAVLADSRAAPLVAAKRRGLGAALVINQARLMAPRALGALRPAVEVPFAQALGFLWSLADLVVVPDLPPPYTIAQEQLSAIPHIRGKLRFVGLPVEDCRGAEPEWLPPRRPFALFTISGPEETRRPMVMKSLGAARLLARRGWSALISTADVGERGLREVDDGVYLCGWCGCIDRYMASADVLVARAGHTTIGKAIYYGRPSVLLPIPFHGEQESNALRAQEMGVARAILRSDLVSEEELADEVEEAAAMDRGRLERVSAIARSMDLARLGADAVEEIL